MLLQELRTAGLLAASIGFLFTGVAVCPVLAAPDDDEEYAAVDRHARAAPETAEASISKLAAYLSRGARGDRDKARAIFVWIVDRLAYDYDNVATRKWEQRPSVVLQKRCTDCGGQSQLFAALAREAGLEAVVVYGSNRSLELSPTHNVRYVKRAANGCIYGTHAWNAVKLDGKWHLLDITYANGRGFEKGKIEQRRPEDLSWFLVPPEFLIGINLPDEPRWQLLPKPVSRAEHERLPMLHRGAFQYGITVREPAECCVKADRELTFTLDVPQTVHVYGVLQREGKPVDLPHVLVQRTAKATEVVTQYPEPGVWFLRVFAAEKKESRFTDPVATFRIEVKTANKNAAPFPTVFGMFTGHDGYLHEPRNGQLVAGKQQRFEVSLPDAVQAAVKTGGKFVPLEKKGSRFVGDVVVDKGEVFLTAEFPERKNFSYALVRYTAE